MIAYLIVIFLGCDVAIGVVQIWKQRSESAKISAKIDSQIDANSNLVSEIKKACEQIAQTGKSLRDVLQSMMKGINIPPKRGTYPSNPEESSPGSKRLL